MTPSSAGRYQLHARIGQGATGVVYEAVDPKGSRPIAVKVMSQEVAQDPAFRQHFLREARAVSRLRHRHLAVVYDVAANDEAPFVAMERLHGRTLADRLTTSPPLTLLESLEIVEQVCLGLQFAHEHGLVHRNVTPANIWILEDGSVKLVDFGLPSASAPGAASDARRYVDRVAYLAPEQITGGAVDGRADIFAAGVVLYELVVGRRPFEGDSIAAMFDRVIKQAYPSVRGLVPSEAEPLEEVFGLALAKDAERRYPDALTMAADLTMARLDVIGVDRSTTEEDVPEEEAAAPQETPALLDPEEFTAPEWEEHVAPPAPAWEPETWESTPLVHPTTPVVNREPSFGERVRSAIDSVTQRNPMMAAAAAVAVVLAIVAGGWLAWRTPPPPSTSTGASGRASPTRPTTPAPTAEVAEVRLESEPADAEVFVNGAALGSRTPVSIPADRLRNAELRLVKPGYEPLTVRVTPDDVARKAMSLQLQAETPPIVVTGSAPFEFEVVSGRTVISRAATSHRFTLRGEQTVRVRAPQYYLDRAVTIPAGKPAVTLVVPALGRLSVRVSPVLERCRVLVGGREFGTPPYPPVPYQAIVAGAHRVQLVCPDGATREETVTVEAARDRAAIFR